MSDIAVDAREGRSRERGIDPKMTALLLIDMQNGACAPELLAEARRSGSGLAARLPY